MTAHQDTVNAIAVVGTITGDYSERPRGMDSRSYARANDVLSRLFPAALAGNVDAVEAAQAALEALDGLEPPHNSLDRLRLRRALDVLRAAAGGHDTAAAGAVLTLLQRGAA